MRMYRGMNAVAVGLLFLLLACPANSINRVDAHGDLRDTGPRPQVILWSLAVGGDAVLWFLGVDDSTLGETPGLGVLRGQVSS